MKIAIAQTNPIIGDFDYNFRKIKHFSEKAAALSCDLIAFSELVVSGYPPQDFLEKRDFVEANYNCLNRLLSAIHGIGVLCGFVDKNPVNKGKPLYNSAVLFEDGNILHKVNKQLLPTYDVFDERRYFEPGKESIPYTYKGCRIGLAVCEDGWNDEDVFKERIYPIDPVSKIVQKGADVVINISASPFYVGHSEFRKYMFGSMARKHGVPFIFVNQVGGNDSLVFDGLSLAFDKTGKIAARASDFEEDLVVFDTEAPELGDIHSISNSDTESVLKALVMGTRDYVSKCGFSRAVVGLSGGIDSAVTASIAAMALGKENLSLVFMPSRYTSSENHEDTKVLSGNMGIPLEHIPIDGMYQEFLKYLSPDFKESELGITEQNIQARIRGNILMGLSNRRGSIVLSTGNKSELAVGYCTLYGDMSGGLSIISDVPKTMVYELAHFINKENAVIPQRIIDKAPSAELKPDQTDQDDLPPYDILDQILKGYVEDLKGVDELVKTGFDRDLVKDIISKIHRNEYKRHQAAPGLKVTSKAFGYGRRYPLAQRYTPT